MVRSIDKRIVVIDIKFSRPKKGIGVPYAFILKYSNRNKTRSKRHPYFIYRTIDDFINALNSLCDTSRGKLRIFCPNVSQMFGWLNQYYEFNSISELEDKQSPMLLVTKATDIIMLDNDKFSIYGINQMIGSHIRHLHREYKDLDVKYINPINDIILPQTPLTLEQEKYCVNNCEMMYSYIEYLSSKNMYRGVRNIPITKAQAIKRAFFNRMNKKKDRIKASNWNELIFNNKITDESEVKFIKHCYSNGYSGVTDEYTNHYLNNITHADISSAHPTSMCLREYPINTMLNHGYNLNKRDDNHFYFFKVKFVDISLKKDGFPIINDTILGGYNLVKWDEEVKTHAESNGQTHCRIKAGKNIIVYCDEVRYKTIKDNYNVNGEQILEYLEYEKGYLPHQLTEYMLDAYKSKEEMENLGLKDTIDYINKKLFLNVIYGQCGVSPIKNGKTIESYNKTNKRFFYPWGCVTASWTENIIIQLAKAIGKSNVVNIHTDCVDYIGNHDGVIKKFNEFISSKFDIIWEDTSYSNNMGKIKCETYKEIYFSSPNKYFCIDSNGSYKGCCGGVDKDELDKFFSTSNRDTIYDAVINGNVGYFRETVNVAYADKISGKATDYLGNTYHYKVNGYCY